MPIASLRVKGADAVYVDGVWTGRGLRVDQPILQNATDAGLAAWQAHGEVPTTFELAAIADAGRDNVMPSRLLQLESQRCIEAYFEDEAADLASAEALLAALCPPGWQMTAVVPLRQLGTAHEAFRSCDVLLQAWWRDAEGIVRFSGCERA